MIVFPKQICKRILPDTSTGESRSDKTFFLKTNMELEVCTSLGSMFHRKGALFVKEIRPANDAGWNGRKSPCCRPWVPCWCSWKLSFCRSNAGADCWWQRRMVVNSCRDQRWDKRVSFKFPVSGKTSSWGWTPARHRTAFLQSASILEVFALSVLFFQCQMKFQISPVLSNEGSFSIVKPPSSTRPIITYTSIFNAFALSVLLFQCQMTFSSALSNKRSSQ